MESKHPLDRTDIEQTVHTLHAGDQLRVPAQYCDGVACLATVQCVYPHVVSFLSSAGTKFSLTYVDVVNILAMQEKIAIGRDEEMETDDIFLNMR